MISPPVGVQIWLAAGATDMRRGFDGLAALVAQKLNQDPFSGALFIFRGRRGHLVKTSSGMARGWCSTPSGWNAVTFVWPASNDGAVSLTPAQLSMLTEGIDWRRPARTWQPEMIG